MADIEEEVKKQGSTNALDWFKKEYCAACNRKKDNKRNCSFLVACLLANVLFEFYTQREESPVL